MSDLSDDDRALFRDAVDGTRPIRRKERVKPKTDQPAPEPRHSQESEAGVMEELLTHEIDPEQHDTGDTLEFLRPGLQMRVLKRLKRGQFTIGDELDLHHTRSFEARRMLGDFLTEARHSGIHCVRIIHGKGRRSRDGEAILRRVVGGFLRRHPKVLAFTAARREDGGSGAVVVLLAK